MNHHFELYVTEDNLSAEKWQKLYGALVSYLGLFGKFEVTFTCHSNTVRYFISSNKDISTLSNNLDGMLLRPVETKLIEAPATIGNERMVQFVTGGNILDLREKTAVKRTKQLDYAMFSVRIVTIDKAYVRGALFFKDAGGTWTRTNKTATFFPSKLLAVDFKHNSKYLKKTVPKYLNIEKSLHLMSTDDTGALFAVDTFPYFSQDHYVKLTSYDFDKHSFIVGASGSGKSKFITLLVDRLAATQLKMNYRVVVIDPHAALAEDFAPAGDTKIISFGSDEGTDLFPGAETDLTSATELTATLFRSVLGEQFNPRVDKLLRFCLFTLMTAQAMNLENLRRFLNETDYRERILQHVRGYIPDNVAHFFGADFNEYRTQYYNEAILPIVSMIDEMQLQPSLVNESNVSLARTIQENFLTVFSLNKVSMGDKVVRTVAGLLIQQIFLLAQARAFGQKVLLVIDEVSVVQNPALAQILAEARKFNLTVILTQQYFGQIDKDLRDAVFANVLNYYVFKVSEEDARALEGNLTIELPKEIIESEHAYGVSESDVKIKLLSEQHIRECFVRVTANGQVIPCFKARTVDAPHAKKVEVTSLKPVKQRLPEKFVDAGRSPVEFSPKFHRMMQQHDRSSHSFRFTSIRDMIASESSSRKNVNNQKDTP